MPGKLPMMPPVRFDEDVLEIVKVKQDPAFRELSMGLTKQIRDLLRDPSRLAIDCCFEGCCVSWCCIQLT